MKYLSIVFRSLLPAILLSIAPSAYSQTMTTGNVSGVITDQSGAVVPAAKVTITYSDTNEVRSTVTGETGQHRFPLLRPGAYTISALTASLKSEAVRFPPAVSRRGGDSRSTQLTIIAVGQAVSPAGA